MQHRSFKPKNHFFIILLLSGLAVLSTGFSHYTQTTDYIELSNNRLAIKPKEFYIAAVTDSRDNVTSIGKIISIIGRQPALTTIDVKGGTQGIKKYFDSCLPVDKSMHPVIVKIRSVTVIETPIAGGRVNGQILLSVSFGLKRADTIIHLVDYKGSATYQRSIGPAQQLEPLLKSTIDKSLVYLNNWMNAQADNNVKLAKGVKLLFSYYSEPIEGDTIYYNINRPLNWTDFKEKAKPGGKYGAEIFASLGYNETVFVEKGIIYVSIALKPFTPKSACWVNAGTADSYSLNHEQRHFDIVMLAAAHFKKALQTEKLSTDNYDGPINVAYFEALREIDKVQKLYDKETDHSINTYNQQLWNNRIERELLELGIKPTNS